MHFPSQHMEIENIYAQMRAANLRSIAVSSANPGEGVTSVAIALAQRHLLSGHATLLIDLNLYRPSLRPELALNSPEMTASSLGLPQLISDDSHAISLMGITAPRDRATILKLRKPGELESCLSACQKIYDTIIIDTSPLNRCNGNNIPAERVAQACDAALLVVLAGQTREVDVNRAMQRLRSTGASLAGCVINDRFNPPLQAELVRETRRLPTCFSGLTARLEKWINASHFLSMVD